MGGTNDLSVMCPTSCLMTAGISSALPVHSATLDGMKSVENGWMEVTWWHTKGTPILVQVGCARPVFCLLKSSRFPHSWQRPTLYHFPLSSIHSSIIILPHPPSVFSLSPPCPLIPPPVIFLCCLCLSLSPLSCTDPSLHPTLCPSLMNNSRCALFDLMGD